MTGKKAYSPKRATNVVQKLATRAAGRGITGAAVAKGSGPNRYQKAVKALGQSEVNRLVRQTKRSEKKPVFGSGAVTPPSKDRMPSLKKVPKGYGTKKGGNPPMRKG